MIKMFSMTIVVAAVLAGFVYLAGASEPINYESQMTQLFDDRRDVLWDILLNVDRFTRFKRGVERVEILSSQYEPLHWKEHMGDGEYRTYRIASIEPKRYLKIEMLESSYGVTGTWEFFVEKENNQTKITIKEESKNVNTWLRGIHNFQGRDVLLEKEMRWIRAALFNNLVNSS